MAVSEDIVAITPRGAISGVAGSHDAVDRDSSCGVRTSEGCADRCQLAGAEGGDDRW